MKRDKPPPVPYSIKRHGISLANCDDEPVQTPGCIQAHGLLLALRLDDFIVVQVSENCQRWTGLPVDQVLGRALSHVVGADAAERIRALAQTELIDRNPCHALSTRLPGKDADAAVMDMTIHTADGVLLLELEPSGRGPPVIGQDGDYFSMVRKTIGRLKNTQSLAAFCDVVALEAADRLPDHREVVAVLADDGWASAARFHLEQQHAVGRVDAHVHHRSICLCPGQPG